MKKISKTFRIGEYAIGGKIKVKINNENVKIQAVDYNSDYVVDEGDFESNMINQIDYYLNELTSSYYADKILSYIKLNV